MAIRVARAFRRRRKATDDNQSSRFSKSNGHLDNPVWPFYFQWAILLASTTGLGYLSPSRHQNIGASVLGGMAERLKAPVC